MLDLYILRHAKSSWKDLSLDDFDRPLNKRGKLNATQMGRFLAENNISPELVLCSTANRCKETLKRSISEGFAPSQHVFLDQLYMASSSEILEEIKNTLDVIRSIETISSLMIIGHNPGLENLIELLVKNKKHPDFLSIRAKFPTCALVHIQFDIDCWSKLAPNSGSLYCYITPKQHLSQDR